MMEKEQGNCEKQVIEHALKPHSTHVGVLPICEITQGGGMSDKEPPNPCLQPIFE